MSVRFDRGIFGRPDRYFAWVGTVTAAEGENVSVRWDPADGKPFEADAHYRDWILEKAPAEAIV
jgi:hypothetical protein